MPTSDAPVFPQKRSPGRRGRFTALRAIAALLLREMATTYGRTPGGYIWAILEPVAGITLLTIAFSIGFVAPPLGINFPIFYATGLLPFIMFMDLTNKTGHALPFSKPLLHYPGITFLDALLARFLLCLMTQILVSYVIFAGILLCFKTQLIPDFGIILTAFLLNAFLAFSVGVMNAFLFLRFDIWGRIWPVITRPLFIVSGIFFLPESIPDPYQGIMLLNPLAHIIGFLRSGFYTSYDAQYVSLIFVMLFSAALLAVGLLLLRRNYRDLLTR